MGRGVSSGAGLERRAAPRCADCFVAPGQARIPVMEKEVQKLEGAVKEASAARETLADANKKTVAARREELQAELGPKRDALRKALATERAALEERQAALDARRQGEQGEALRQVSEAPDTVAPAPERRRIKQIHQQSECWNIR